VDTHEIAWAAGFFDGEGTTQYGEYISRGNSCRSMRMSIAQREYEPLQRFRQAMFGLGRIRVDVRAGHTTMHVWAVSNWRDVQACVAAMWPFLCQPKRDQAKHALMHIPEMAARSYVRRKPYKPDSYLAVSNGDRRKAVDSLSLAGA